MTSFAKRYGFVGKSDASTAYKLPQLVEGYVNFGIPGVIVAMYFIGLSYRFIQDMFSGGLASGGSIVGLAFVYVGLCDIEGNYSMQFGGLFITLMFLCLVRLWLVLWERLSDGSEAPSGEVFATKMAS